MTNTTGETIPPAQESDSSARQSDLPLSLQDETRQLLVLKALADPTRLHILDVLSRQGGEITVQELVDRFPVVQPTISHHLRLLREAELVEARKRGLYSYYYLCPLALAQVQAFINRFVTACEIHRTRPEYHEESPL